MRETEATNVETYAILANCSSKISAISLMRKKQQEKAWTHLSSLTIQGESFVTISSAIDKKEMGLWAKVIEKCPDVIANFTHKALLQVLPSAANLYRWKKIPDPQCVLCNQGLNQTNKHVLAN